MKTRLMTAILGVAALVLTACGSSDPLGSDSSGGGGGSITVGSANFPESQLIAEMYAQALEGAGVKVDRKPNIGARDVYLKALEDNSIGLVPEYNGALLAYLTKQDVPKDASSSDQVNAAIAKVLPSTLTMLDPAAAEDKDTLTVTKETADKYKLSSISDLAPVAKDLVIGAAPEFKTHWQGLVGLKEAYGLDFKEFTPLDPGGPLSINALKDGSVQVTDIFSTDSAIKTNNFVVLKDEKNLFAAQNVVPLIRTEFASDTAKAAINAVSKALTTDVLSTYLAEVQVDKKDVATVAKEFIKKYNVK